MDPRISDQTLIPVSVWCAYINFRIYICMYVKSALMQMRKNDRTRNYWRPVKAMWAKGSRYGMLLVNIDEFAILKI